MTAQVGFDWTGVIARHPNFMPIKGWLPGLTTRPVPGVPNRLWWLDSLIPGGVVMLRKVNLQVTAYCNPSFYRDINRIHNMTDAWSVAHVALEEGEALRVTVAASKPSVRAPASARPARKPVAVDEPTLAQRITKLVEVMVVMADRGEDMTAEKLSTLTANYAKAHELLSAQEELVLHLRGMLDVAACQLREFNE